MAFTLGIQIQLLGCRLKKENAMQCTQQLLTKLGPKCQPFLRTKKEKEEILTGGEHNSASEREKGGQER